jgi:hypothetical protein
MPEAMLDLQTAQDIGWKVSMVLRASLFCLVAYRRNLRTFPFFGAYLLINVAKGLLAALLYQNWGLKADLTFNVIWAAEGVVTCARALAVAELCRLMLGAYRGIWSLASRVLVSCAGLIIIYAALTTTPTLRAFVLEFSRATELAIATVIVLLFVFLHHYEVVVEPALTRIALGFCIYACVAVVNLSILEQYLNAYDVYWNILDVYTFMCCLMIWIWALRQTVPIATNALTLFSQGVYQQLSPEINGRLRELNERLSQFWRTEAPPS